MFGYIPSSVLRGVVVVLQIIIPRCSDGKDTRVSECSLTPIQHIFF